MQFFNAPKEKDEPAGETIYFKHLAIRKKRDLYLRCLIILIAINLVLVLQSFGQMVTVNNVTITNSAQITVKGDILQNNGGVIFNDGTVDLTGNYTNNSGTNGFGVSAGTVLMNGGVQAINGSYTTTFNNLILSGLANKVLNQNITVGGAYAGPSGVLSLNNRVLDLNSNTLTITNGSGNAITRTSGFIHSETDPMAGYGTIRWNIGANTGNYIFPFGNAGTSSYLPVTLNITSAGTGSSGYLAVSTYPTVTSATPNNRPLPTGLSSLMSYAGSENAHRVADRWWVFDTQNYSSQPVSNLTLSYRDSEWDGSNGSTNTIVENMLRAQSSDGTSWTPIPAGVINTAANTITINGVGYYNPYWTLAGNDGPLPITLLVFDATLNKRKTTDLNWITATEVDNDYFTLEKSRDGFFFEPFATVKGSGNSNSPITYSAEDKSPFNGTTYYRLKSTDFDGTYKYSDIRVVHLQESGKTAFEVYPNPVTTHYTIKDSAEGEQKYALRDGSGRTVREIIKDDGNLEITMDREGLSPGVYFLSNSLREVKKIIFR